MGGHSSPPYKDHPALHVASAFTFPVPFGRSDSTHLAPASVLSLISLSL